MKLLAKAQQLTQQPVTFDSLVELDTLCGQAKGIEAERIADLQETLLELASDDVYHLWMEYLVQEAANGGH
ncbi:hypothetical protein [Photobacterium sanguinicancri]|uniref:hypothetical protein n=1 Tax=Photobacterium sanguinicancri TaxID=875932 RepID=UPI0026E1304A|nr:hypothetical protein [Photobacterium sanguinicancri]MDO6497336.1 hypothetical protein [Photobacterium sanguinicancri]